MTMLAVEHDMLTDIAALRETRLAGENPAIDLVDHLKDKVRDPFSFLNHRTTEELIEKWVSDHTNLSVEDFFTSIACYPHKESLLSLLTYPYVPADALRLMAVYPDTQVMAQVGIHRNVPLDVLTYLSRHHSVPVRTGVVNTQAVIPADLQDEIARDLDEYIRLCLATRSDTDPDLLSRLATSDSAVGVRIRAIDNPRLPLATAKQLLATGLAASTAPRWLEPLMHAGVRYGDKEFTEDIAKAATTRYKMVWASLLENEKTPVSLLIAAGKRRSTLNVEAGLALAENPRTPTQTLDRLAKDRRSSIQQAVAAHGNTSTEALIKLGASDKKQIAETAYRNPNMPVTELVIELKDHRRIAAAANPSTPSGVLVRWAVEAVTSTGSYWALMRDRETIDALVTNPSLPREGWETLLSTENNSYTATALTAPLCPTEFVLNACMSTEWFMRRSATNNPNCPEEGRVMASLAGGV